MNKFFATITFLSLSLYSAAQYNASQNISDMKWGADFNIHITFSNDSSSIMDVKALYHSQSNIDFNSSSDVTYYPVSLDDEFLNELQNKKIESFVEPMDSTPKKNKSAKSKTLWSAIHYDIGGGWIHFINCLVYSIESNQVSILAPLMKRPETKWKPSPMTESYQRTQKWNYYVPETQKLAQKEYKIKLKKGELGDIQFLPKYFTELFLNTTDKQYAKYIEEKQTNKTAIIDMVKLLLGSNYLGQEQIDFIQSAVNRALTQYTINSLPSIIIFDDFEAAVAMTLNDEGYKINKIVFNNESNLTLEEIKQRTERMEGIINRINEVNKKVFEKNLKQYYN